MKNKQDFTQEVFRRAAGRIERARRVRATVIPLAAAVLIAGIGGAVWINRSGTAMIDNPVPELASESGGGTENSRSAGNSTTAKSTATGTAGNPSETRTSSGNNPSDTTSAKQAKCPTTTAKTGFVYAFNATITDLTGDTVTVEPDHSSREYQSGSAIVFSFGNSAETDVKVGDRIWILYDGEISETYPARITVLQWKILDKAKCPVEQ